MARILISESHEDVRRLLVRMLTQLGHDPLVVIAPSPEQLLSADALLVEPAAPIGVVLAQTAHLINPSLPLICASVEGAPAELVELGVVFAAQLVKPFTAKQLGGAIERSLSVEQGRDVHPARHRGKRAA